GDVVGGQFKIVREIGRGGLGVVYRARDTKLHRDVAIKVMSGAGRGDLFEHEAKATAQIAHPNVVTIHQSARGNKTPYLVLEVLEGCTLGDRLHAGDVPLTEALNIMIDVSDALAFAHGKGVFHRDLTSSNVFLTRDGKVKILDFGLAKLDWRRESI